MSPEGDGRPITSAWSYSLQRVQKRDVGFAVVVVVAVIALCGCSGSRRAAPSPSSASAGMRFVAASRVLLAKCRATARAVGYPVACPTYIPTGLTVGSSTTSTGCLDVIGPDGRPSCPAGKAWRGWVVGTSNVGREHLVITASPTLLKNYAKLVNGPAWYPRAKVRPLGWVEIDGRRMRSLSYRRQPTTAARSCTTSCSPGARAGTRTASASTTPEGSAERFF